MSLVGTNGTSWVRPAMSVDWGRPEVTAEDQTDAFDPKLTFTMPTLPKYSVRHEESVCNSRATHSRRLRRSSFRSEAGLCRSTVRRMPTNSSAATGQ